MEPKEPEKSTDYETRALLACLEVGKLLTSTYDLKEILRLIMARVSDLIKAQNWSLFLRDEATGELSFEIVVGIQREKLNGVRLARGEGISGYVAETGNPVLISNVQEDSRFNRKIDGMTGFRTESIACVPLQIHGKVLGVIEIVNVKDMGAFQTKYLQILTILADYAAVAIENSRFIAQIQRMSMTDEYTGLYNARYLYRVLEELVVRAAQSGEPFAVVFADVDNFKTVVDTYGHLLGSRVLKEIGGVIYESLQEKDILIKYGGDEYVILLPGRDRQEAKTFLAKIHQSVRSAVYLRSESEPVKLTASFGIAIYPEDAQTPKDLLLQADRALYSVKKSTKDAVGIFDY